MLIPARGTLLLTSALVAYLSFVQALQADTPSCRDEDGNSVDWFIAYKLPMLAYQEEPFGSGAGYIYISSNQLNDGDLSEDNEKFLKNFKDLLNVHLGVSSQPGETTNEFSWTVSKFPIDHEESMIMRSLGPTYHKDRPKSWNWILYNDQPPTPSNGEDSVVMSQNRAHAKGFVSIDTDSGDAMWLSHTVPQFPPAVGESLAFNANAFRHGQTFICLNYDAKKEGVKVVKHLSNMFAPIHNSRVTPKLRRMIPEIDDLKLEGERSGLRLKERLAGLDQVFETRAGQQFDLYSKSSNLEGDMYAAWLTDKLDTSLYVETWRNGNGEPLGSDCPRDKYQVYNIESMHVEGEEDEQLFSWPYTKDHSKWAISELKEDGIVCLADINRMASQFKRGGGAICLRNPKVWEAFSETIEYSEDCRYKTKASKGAKLSDMRQKLAEKLKHLLLEA